MKHLASALALCAALSVSACTGSPSSSAPPAPVSALTTETPVDREADDQAALTRAPSSESAPSTLQPSDAADRTATVDSAPQTSDPRGVPPIPDEAKRRTEDGAAAFVAHYFTLVSYLGEVPRTGVIEPLAAAGCAACSNYQENIDYLIAEDAAANGASLRIGRPEASVAEDAALVTIDLTQNGYMNVNADGEEINTFAPTKARTATVELRWVNNAWLVQRISTGAN